MIGKTNATNSLKEAEIPTVSVGYGISDGFGYVKWGNDPKIDTDIVIPSIYQGLPVTSIARNAFENCKLLTSVVIPSSVTTMGTSAFGYCTSLKKVVIEKGLTKISDFVTELF